MTPAYDQRIANEAAAVDQCMKLGAVLLTPRPTATGFGTPTMAPTPPARPER